LITTSPATSASRATRATSTGWLHHVEHGDAGRGRGRGELLEPDAGARRPAHGAVARTALERQPDRAGDRGGGGVAGGGGDDAHVVAGLGQRDRGGEPDHAGADDRDLHQRRSARTSAA
jgi:hypothetical protein